MPMGNAWAWPSRLINTERTLAAMLEFAQQCADRARQCSEAGHPLEITHALASEHDQIAADVQQRLGLEEAIPRLAQLVAASPLEAAIYDAYGRSLEQNAYNLLSGQYVNRDLSAYLSDEFAGEFLDQYTLREPKARMPLYHLVGALDPLTAADLSTRINDGLPETLGEWIVADGLTHLKIKLAGDDL